MSKYDSLGAFLRQQNKEQVSMTFTEIERVIGRPLPKSQRYQAWWSNSTTNNVMTQVWLDAGYRTEQVDTVQRRLVFRRAAPRHPALEEDAKMFKPAPQGAFSAVHPLIGALRGTFAVTSWDAGQPSLDAAEQAQMDDGIEKTARLIEEGMRAR